MKPLLLIMKIIKKTIHLAECKLKIKKLGIKRKTKIVLLDDAPLFFKEIGIDGVLGNDFIAYYNWKIDFENQKLNTYKKINSNQLIKLANFWTDRYELATTLEVNSVKDTFFIDLGFTGVLTTSRRPEDEKIEYVKVGYRGSVITSDIDSSFFSTPNICFLGKYCFSNVPMSWSKNNKGNLIGTLFLEKFGVIYLDNFSHSLWVKEQKDLQFYLPYAKTVNSKVLAITSEKGKSNTSVKIGQILTEEQIKVIKSFKLPLSKYFDK